MKEVAWQFGDRRQLVGVVTEPSSATTGVGCILITAGLLPKPGPFRLYTQLARRLAHEGVVTLRFDLGGIGDSQRTSAGRLEARTLVEIKSAVDSLAEAYPINRTVLGGLCSGAEDAFRFAEHDRRIVDVAMIDPFAYRTWGWSWRHQLFRVRRRLLRTLGVFQPFSGSSGGGGAVVYQCMERGESQRILEALLVRRVGVHFFYTGGRCEDFNYPGQIKEMFPGLDLRGLVTVDYFPHFGHTQPFQEDRDTLIEAIASRIGEPKSEPLHAGT